ncbi:MAG: hypothetical protein RQ866_06560 [Bacteroidales bacterium]|nr:hypothetical protein [Bacteroidales bacterium]
MVILKKIALSGHTLVESVVAMVVITMMAGTGLSLYLKVLQSDSTVLRLHAKMQVNTMMNKSYTAGAWFGEEVAMDDFMIVKSVTPFPDNSSMVVIRIVAATPEGRVLYHRTRLSSTTTERIDERTR